MSRLQMPDSSILHLAPSQPQPSHITQPSRSPFPLDYPSPSSTSQSPPRSSPRGSPKTTQISHTETTRVLGLPLSNAAARSSRMWPDSPSGSSDTGEISAPLSTARLRPTAFAASAGDGHVRKPSGDEENAPLIRSAVVVGPAAASAGAMSRADSARWAVTGIVLVLFLYACVATLAPPLLARFGLALGRGSLNGAGSSPFDRAASYPLLLADSVFEDDVPRARSAAASSSSSAVAARSLSGHAPSMPNRMAVSAEPCNGCSFRFPRPPAGSPTSSIFVTGVPNHGAGVGHQFGEWLTGPWLARMLNLTYISTELLKQSARWVTFLGHCEGEDTIEDLYQTYGGVARVLKRSQMDPREDFNAYPMLNWTRDAIERVRRDPGVSTATAAVDPARLTVAQRTLTPSLPFPVMVEAHMVSIPYHETVCEPVLNRILRQKYCAARIRNPVPVDLYREDREANKIIVTWHLRCGDSCYSTFRSTSFESVTKTSLAVMTLMRQLEPTREVVFYLFSQKPDNNTAEAHFAPLLDKMAQHSMQVKANWQAKSTTVMHHLITSGQKQQ